MEYKSAAKPRGWFKQEYARVNDQCPCQLCGRPDWCLLHKSGTHGICARVATGKKVGQAGWEYPITGPIVVPETEHAKETIDPSIAYAFAEQCRRRITPAQQNALASELGVSSIAVTSLCIGWCDERAAYTIPMRDGSGRVVGVQFRRGSKKWSLTGSQFGLFMPQGWHTNSKSTIYSPEGMSDTAALLSIGLFAIGRPSCNTGAYDLRVFLRRNPRWVRGIPPVVIVTDDDANNVGEKWAREVVKSIAGAKVLIPRTAKDARESIIAGCRQKDFRSALRGRYNKHWRLLDAESGQA